MVTRAISAYCNDDAYTQNIARNDRAPITSARPDRCTAHSFAATAPTTSRHASATIAISATRVTGQPGGALMIGTASRCRSTLSMSPPRAGRDRPADPPPGSPRETPSDHCSAARRQCHRWNCLDDSGPGALAPGVVRAAVRGVAAARPGVEQGHGEGRVPRYPPTGAVLPPFLGGAGDPGLVVFDPDPPPLAPPPEDAVGLGADDSDDSGDSGDDPVVGAGAD